MIEVIHLTKTFPLPGGGEQRVLDDVSFSIGRGEVVGIIGPSGGGKSVLLRSLNLLVSPDGGQIVVDGRNIMERGYPIARLRQRMGMVFQQFNLFPHLSVLDNITLAPMKLKGMSREEATELAMRHLRRVAMADKASAMPRELSGGQQQRTAIARCLAMEPEVILFDEPTSSLDPSMVGEVQGVVRTLAQEGLTMVVVTHEMGFARDVCSRILFLSGGRLVEDGAPEDIFEHPRDKETEAFVHRIRRLVFDIESRDFDFYDMTSQIKQFCIRSSVAGKMNQITHIVDEMLMLLARYEKPVHIEVQHSDLSGQTSVVVVHKGERVSPLSRPEADELAVMILRGMSQEIVEELVPEGVQLTFRL